MATLDITADGTSVNTPYLRNMERLNTMTPAPCHLHITFAVNANPLNDITIHFNIFTSTHSAIMEELKKAVKKIVP